MGDGCCKQNSLWWRFSLTLYALIGYALVALVVTLFVRPFLNIERSIFAYFAPFGLVYVLLMFFAPTDNFSAGWHRYIGITLGIILLFLFYLKVRSYVNKKKYEEEMARAAMEEAENSWILYFKTNEDNCNDRLKKN